MHGVPATAVAVHRIHPLRLTPATRLHASSPVKFRPARKSAVTRHEFPPVVYVPTTSGEAAIDRQVEMRRDDQGRVILFCYSAIDRLRDMFRSDSSWVLLNVEELQRLHDLTPYDQLVLDVVCGFGDQDANAQTVVR